MSEEVKEKKIKVTGEQCQSCGSVITFDPQSKKLKCKACGTEEDFEQIKGIEKHDFKENAADNKEWGETKRTFQCKTCGAQVETTGFATTVTCPYCGGQYVEEVNELPNLKPDFVIPFKYDFKQIVDVFKKQAKKKFFAPREFKKNIPESSIKGYYIPSFMFDADTHSKYVGTVEHVYYTRDSKGNSVRHSQILPIAGARDDQFRNLVHSADYRVEDKLMHSVLPYELDEAYTYNPNFLRGFISNHYSVSLDKGFEAFKGEADATIRANIRASYTDRVVTLDVTTKYENSKYTYALFPVYTFSFKYKGKDYLAYMNGQTGKLGKGLPLSGLKIAICIILGLAIIAGIVVGIIFAMK